MSNELTPYQSFVALTPQEQDFVLAVAHGASAGEAAAGPWPDHVNKRDKGWRLLKRQDIQDALTEIRQLRSQEQDISFDRMKDRLFILFDEVKQAGSSPKHLEIRYRILQELNKMAGHIISNINHTHVEQGSIEIIYESPTQVIPEESSEPEADDTDQDQTDAEASTSP